MFSEQLLSAVKQQSHFFKTQLNLRTFQSHELVSRMHGFVNWHDLHTTAMRHAFDNRIRAAAISKRAQPWMLTEETIQISLKSIARLANEYNDIDAEKMFLESRGLSSLEDLHRTENASAIFRHASF